MSSSLIAFGFLAQVVTRLDPFVGDPEGEKRSVTEIDADEVAPSLRWATARPERPSAAATANALRSGASSTTPTHLLNGG